MLAGGTGVTPMVQLARAILADPRDRTEVRLILANKTRGDIMLKEELDALAAAHPQFSVVYTLDSPDEDWKVRSPRLLRATLGGGQLARGGALSPPTPRAAPSTAPPLPPLPSLPRAPRPRHCRASAASSARR